jgi:O-antigen ligase
VDDGKKITAVWSEQLQFAGACSFSAALWMRQDVAHLLLILTLCVSLSRFQFPLFKKRWTEVLVLSQIFLLALVSCLYSANKEEAFFVLEKQMTLLLLPVFFGASIEWSRPSIEKILSIFSFSVTIAVSYLLFVFYQSYQTQRETGSLGEFLNSHLHHAFSEPLHLHATYLSMYVCFAIAVCIYRLYKERGWLQWLSCLMLVPLFLSLILLSSRIVIVPFACILVLVLPFFLRRRALILHLGLLAVLLFIGLRYVGNFSAIQDRFRNDTLRELNISSDAKIHYRFDTIHTNDATRAERWQCALELIGERPLLGYGTGMEKQMLNVKYEKYKLSNSILNGFDAHNQYLAYMIKSGILGLLSFLLLLSFCFYRAIRTKNFYFISFLLIVSITALTENVLESNKGILFFSFFSALFLCSAFPTSPQLARNKSQ